MKNKKILSIIFCLLAVLVGYLIFSNLNNDKDRFKNMSIEEVLKTDSYKYLSPNVKEFIYDYYEENGEILLTQDLAKDGEEYLNPNFIEYLDNDNKDKEEFGLVPSVTAYTPKLSGAKSSYPSSFDLRNVNGKNFVTPNKNQGNEGLCWAYATASVLETHDLMVKNKSYDSSAILFSEKQFDYANSTNGIIGGNKVVDTQGRTLGIANHAFAAPLLMAERIGGFQDTWNTENYDIISKNGKLEPYIVFDSSKAKYEVGEVQVLFNIVGSSPDTEYNEAVKDTIKGFIYNHGGTTISAKVIYSNYLKNYLSGSDEILITNPNYVSLNGVDVGGYHALHLIGWDDNYDYAFCAVDIGGSKGKIISDNAYYNTNHECGTYTYGGQTYDYTKVIGKGAWILKNSWGNSHKFLYLPYDSSYEDVVAITDYANKNWDKSKRLRTLMVSSNNTYKHYLEDPMSYGDPAVKLKLYSNSANPFSLYYSPDGKESSEVLIGNYSFELAGIKTIDLSGKNIRMNAQSYFKTNIKTTSYIFMNNRDSAEEASTSDFVYSSSNEYPTNEKTLLIDVTTHTRNIDSGTAITYLIKKTTGEYLPSSAYTVESNKVYYNMVSPQIKLKEEYAKKGEYILETKKGNTLLDSSSILLKQDYLSIEGDGTNKNPWQIKNVRHFNMIRQKINDNFILMNDLDFEYDTQNENGLFYNSGKGFTPISSFAGNFNGNGKTIKNIKVDGSLFYMYNKFGNCSLSECGIHDLIVENMINNVKYENTGGIIGRIYISYSDKYNYRNLAVINSKFIIDENSHFPGYNSWASIGGIVGALNIEGNTSEKSALRMDNWYSDFELELKKEETNSGGNFAIGGLVGKIDTYYFGAEVSLDSSKVNMIYDLSKAQKENYYVSDLIGFSLEKPYNISAYNTIGNVINKSNSNEKVHENAYVGKIVTDNISGSISINNAKSSLVYTPDNRITLTSSEYNLKQYELARKPYIGTYYFYNNYVYPTAQSNTTKVEFADRFTTYSNMIPTLKSYNETYSTYNDKITMRVGEEKTITDLIKTESNHRYLEIYGSLNCNLDVCNSTTNENIITIPSESNNYKITGLKKGKTSLILYDKLSGYLGKVTITVVSEDGELDSLEVMLGNNGYDVEEEFVTGFTIGSNINQIINELGDDSITISSSSGLISTGSVITKDDESYTVIIKGDLTGDGKINSGDLLQMRKHLLEEVTLTGAYKQAGIIESNNDIKSLDLLRLRQYLLGDYVLR